MQKTIRLLTVLLAVQLLLVLGLNLGGPDLSARSTDAPLLALADKTVDRILITDFSGKQQVLAKKGETWVLAGMGDFPVEDGKVKRFLERLRGLKHGLPVGTSDAALKRFKVVEGDYARRIRLQAGDEVLATLYLGATLGARQVHARSDADDAVYAVNFAIYDAPVNVDAWIDRAVLRFPVKELVGLQVADLSLKREGQGDAAQWTATPVVAGKVVDAKAADALAGQLAGLRISGVLGATARDDYKLQTPALQVEVDRQDGAHIVYRLGKRNNDYVLKVSSRPEYFQLLKRAGDELIAAAKRETLLTAPSSAEKGVTENVARDTK